MDIQKLSNKPREFLKLSQVYPKRKRSNKRVKKETKKKKLTKRK